MKIISAYMMLTSFFLFFSCTVIDGFKKKDFIYYSGKQRHAVVLQIPAKYKDEKIVLDSLGGKEQYYYYENGTLLYVTRNASWATENQAFIEQVKNPFSTDGKFVFKGKDKDGLLWKEIQVENFRFGYTYVPPAIEAKFEQAINSIRFK